MPRNPASTPAHARRRARSGLGVLLVAVLSPVISQAATSTADSVSERARALASTQKLATSAHAALVVPRQLVGSIGGVRGELEAAVFEAQLMGCLHAVAPTRDAWHDVQQLAGVTGDVQMQMLALERQAEMSLLLGDYQAARRLAETLLDTARKANSSELESSAYGYLGVVARRGGDLDTALGHYEKAIALLRNGGNEFRLALMLGNFGTVLRDRGDFAHALELQLEALAIRERIGDHLETSLRNIALLYREIEDEGNARHYFERALASVDAEANPETYAPVLGSYASLLNDVGDYGPALAAASEALAIDQALGNRSNQAFERLESGRAHFGLGKNDEAAALFESALEAGRELGQHEIVARALLHLAEINQAEGHALQARGMIDEAIAGLETARLRPQLLHAYALREKMALADHDLESALRFLRRHAEQRELLLGTRASRQLGELQVRHARAEADKDLALLQKDNELQAVRLDKQEVQAQLGQVVMLGLGVGLLLTFWRFVGVNRLNRALRAKNVEIDEKGKALADANGRLEERAAELYMAAISDPLTGVFNRSHLREQIARRMQPNPGGNRMLAVLLIDFDCFKQINDRLGHLFGDRVLLAGVAAIRQRLATADLLGRFGGEEFVVVLEDERARGAEVIAESIRRSVQDSLSTIDNRGIAVTVSIGLARLSDLGEVAEPGVDALLDAGDRAMYAAKAAGRNRVAVYAPSMSLAKESADGRSIAH
ncbi:MAG: tetratricopeptide repeat-containing diguanylate cyclase [Dokdonella sp.]|uniref:tetratricopeptide repeat-containing diguanylate cyclase n=1 Tax=Dokdonella sp. TaxID=2291710 RepID=UPI002CCB27AF|nr:tetratricopeptide repeat-containing diguanylate cyclase [Dokdonella sp.]HOX71241.1 diguanylate cyclase [Dokdonella sp.]HPN79033.1 diguanylate cyclase [Dokdonella sp.]